MAFAARFAVLNEELVESLTRPLSQTKPNEFRAKCDASLHKLRTHTFLRTNHFEVDSCLDGLDERFRVNCRDDVADALRERLHALRQSPSAWHPELLSLLLELSDQPISKTSLRNLDSHASRCEQKPKAPPLRWEQMAKEDGWDLDEDGLWKSINYSSDDSDDSFGFTDDDRSASASSDATSSAGRRGSAPGASLDCIVHPEDPKLLKAILEAQSWRRTSHPSASFATVVVTEPQAVREVLFMLQGIECNLFHSTSLFPLPAFQVDGIAEETHEVLMGKLADAGLRLRVLRRFASQAQIVPHVQAFQDSVARHLSQLDCALAEIEARLVSPARDVVVSLIGLMGELDAQLDALSKLSKIVTRAQEASQSASFRYLELLFDEASEARLLGESALFEFLLRVFLDCFNIYLRPTQLWMNEGKLMPGNEVFFISESSANVPLGETWRNRFELRRTESGELNVPNFLRPAVGSICNAGKNLVVMRLLGRQDEIATRRVEQAPFDVGSICPAGFELAPFQDLFNNAFECWIERQYRKTWATLKAALFGDWGLAESLDALRMLYLMSEGHAAAALCEAVFASLDAQDGGWHGRYAVTAACREAFSSLPDTNRLSVSIDTVNLRRPESRRGPSVRVALPSVKLHYRLPWPVQMIATAESLTQYQSIFTFLLQIRRAIHAIHQPKIFDRRWTEQGCSDNLSLFYLTRHKLLWFYGALQTYLVTLVLEPSMQEMRRDLEVAEDIDAMVTIHAGAMERLAEQACIGNQQARVREGILDMLDLALGLEQGERRDGADKESHRLLQETASDFAKHLGLICSELRNASRTNRCPHAAKWDVLANMLEMGLDTGRGMDLTDSSASRK